MIKLYSFYKLRLELAKERNYIDRYAILKSCIFDLVFNNVIVIKNGYIVYEDIKSPTTGYRVAYIIGIYIQKRFRNLGMATRLKNLIPLKPIVEIVDFERTNNKRQLGILCVTREA